MNIIKINQLNKSINGKEILHNVTFTVNKNDIYGLLGPNGAGKTTLMKIIMHLSFPTSGTITYWQDQDRKDPSVLRKMGSIIEYPSFYDDLTAFENLEIHCLYMGISQKNINDYMDLVGLRASTQRKVREFSLGMKQRLAIARSIIHKPELLVLDEPINGLDPEGIRDIRELLVTLKNELGLTIIISSHILSEISQVSDKVGIIFDGRLIREVSIDHSSPFTDLEEIYLASVGKSRLLQKEND